MSVVVQCKRCGKELRAKDRYAGMPTRCPRCNTLNQLPSLPSSSAPTNPASKERSPSKKTSPRQQRPAETCALCSQPIRADSERFVDIHGTVCHRDCYQRQAGGASEGVCRICRQPFETLKDRVKDTVGFCYHRKCYQEELERQKLAATGKPRAEAVGPATPSEQLPSAGKPASDVDDWDLTEDDDDWDLTGEVDDDWMRPEPEELNVVEAPKPSTRVPLKPSPFTPLATPPPKKAAKQAPVEPAKSETPKAALPTGSSSSPKTIPKAVPARPSKLPDEAKPPGPVSAAEKPAAKAPSAPAWAPEKPAEEKPVAKKAVPSTPVPSKPAVKKPTGPASGPDKPAVKKPALKKAKPLPRAKPIEPRPAAAAMPEGLELLPERPQAMPEGLELLPDQPQGMPEGLEILPEQPQAMPDGLELLPDAPGSLPAGLEPLPDSSLAAGVDGLEILDDGPAAATARLVSGSPGAAASPAAASLPAGLEPLDDLAPLSQGPGLSPLGAAGAMEPVQGVLLDPLSGEPASHAPRRSRGNDSIPTWLWAVMGIGVGVVVIMLVASLVSIVSTNRQPNQDLASSETVESREESVEDEEPPSQTEWSFKGEAKNSEAGPPLGVRLRSGLGSRLAWFRLLRESMKHATAAQWCWLIVRVGFWLLVFFALTALGLRLACNMCGLKDAPGSGIMTVCVLLWIASMAVSPFTASLGRMEALLIELPCHLIADTVLIRIILSESTSQSIGISIAHFVVSLGLFMTGLVVLYFVSIMLTAVM